MFVDYVGQYNSLLETDEILDKYYFLSKFHQSQTVVILTKYCKMSTFNVNFTSIYCGQSPSPNPTPTGEGIPSTQTPPLGCLRRLVPRRI